MEFTIIHKTKDETQARRVLTAFKPLQVLAIGFIFSDGWYEIAVPQILDEAQAQQLNRAADTYAHTDIKPLPLNAFKQYEY